MNIERPLATTALLLQQLAQLLLSRTNADGQLAATKVGALSKSQLSAFIDSHL